MSGNEETNFPFYQEFVSNLAVLALPISCSELHGTLCGYLCAGAYHAGELYLRALILKDKNEAVRMAARALFEIYSISKQQISSLDFSFELLLPPEDSSLLERARAFSEWCEGFTQGLTLAGVSSDSLIDDEAQEALHHFREFAELDYGQLRIGEEDEKALVDVYEYARMAVLRLSSDLKSTRWDTSHDVAH